jgi:hypothetical protein
MSKPHNTMNYEEIQAAKKIQRDAATESFNLFCAESDKAASFDSASDADYADHRQRLAAHEFAMNKANEELQKLERAEQVLILGEQSANDLQSDA